MRIVGGLTLRNEDPIPIELPGVDEIPSYGSTHGTPPSFTGVPLYDSFLIPQGTLFQFEITTRCQSDADCDDENDCTTDSCDLGSGACQHAPQGLIPFDQTLLAPTIDSLCWDFPADVFMGRGALPDVSSYVPDRTLPLPGATCIFDAQIPPLGFWCLVRPDCGQGSWQNHLGAEPDRDASLP